MVSDHPVDARDDIGHGARARAVQHPHRNERGRLGHAIGGAGQDAGHVRAVPIAVGCAQRVGDHGVPREQPAGEIGLRGQHPGIDDIGTDSAAGSTGCEAGIQWQGSLVDAVKSPGG